MHVELLPQKGSTVESLSVRNAQIQMNSQHSVSFLDTGRLFRTDPE
jgi:hypothetical protein